MVSHDTALQDKRGNEGPHKQLEGRVILTNGLLINKPGPQLINCHCQKFLLTLEHRHLTDDYKVLVNNDEIYNFV